MDAVQPSSPLLIPSLGVWSGEGFPSLDRIYLCVYRQALLHCYQCSTTYTGVKQPKDNEGYRIPIKSKSINSEDCAPKL